jgi:hypothetical protein
MNLPSALTRIDSINLAAALTIGMTTLITLLIPFLFGYWCKRGVRNLVFISYRHDDVVTDIRDQLTSKFGKSAVFLDDKIKEGQHMRQRIKSTLSICGILLPAIGRAWLRETERLRVDPQDYVRMEIVGA